MEFLNALSNSPALLYSTVILLGLCVGSFLNVVIHRLPIMMQQRWQAWAADTVNNNDTNQHSQTSNEEISSKPTPISLAKPSSRCPHCQHKIRAWQNLPVLSYLLLKGRCANCKAAISARYPAIELAAALLGAICVWQFSYSPQLLAALPLCWALLALAMIDFDTQLLPDDITIPFVWLGLLINCFSVFTSLQNAVIGAMAGYLSLWLIFQAFKLLTGKEGMGYGDFKLLALLGAWLGWQALPGIVLMSALAGSIIGGILIARSGQGKQVPFAFGPYLALAGLISLFWGEAIRMAYLQYAGLT